MEIEWTDLERGALGNFLALEGPVKNALVKFTQFRAKQANAMCAMHMRTAPRDHERAADYAAKAQEMEEFWTLLAETLLADEQPALESR